MNLIAIDNILIKPMDPFFLGFTIKNKVNISHKTITKINPLEKIGIYGKNNGNIDILEYIYMNDEFNNLKNSNNSLKYKYGHILNSIFTVDAFK